VEKLLGRAAAVCEQRDVGGGEAGNHGKRRNIHAWEEKRGSGIARCTLVKPLPKNEGGLTG
jgi:hypothetical protein